MKLHLAALLLIIPVLLHAQTVTTDTLITSAEDTIIFSREQQRAIKLGDSTRYITVAKPKPSMLNGQLIFDPSSSLKDVDDSTVFAMYKSTPVRHSKNMDSSIIHIVISNYNEISHAVDSCFKFFDKQLQSGVYSIELNNVVIDSNGKIVHYETAGIKGHAENRSAHLPSMKGYQDIPAPFAELFNHMLNVLLQEQQCTPMIQNQQKVPYYFGRYGTSLSRGDKDKKS